jgi:hypothetical protein
MSAFAHQPQPDDPVQLRLTHMQVVLAGSLLAQHVGTIRSMGAVELSAPMPQNDPRLKVLAEQGNFWTVGDYVDLMESTATALYRSVGMRWP